MSLVYVNTIDPFFLLGSVQLLADQLNSFQRVIAADSAIANCSVCWIDSITVTIICQVETVGICPFVNHQLLCRTVSIPNHD